VNRLIAKIAKKVAADYCRLSIVENPDEFLTRPVVRHLLCQEHGLEVVAGSNLQLRIHFELHYKQEPKNRFLYICQNSAGLLPDMKQEANVCHFDVSDLFPLFADKSLINRQDFEVLNRLDEIITFDQLDLSAIKRIVDLELKPLAERIENLGYQLVVTDKAKEFVATKGYDVQFGARPLKRAIQNYLEDGICELLMDGELKPGDAISIGKNPKKDALSFKIIQN